MPFIRVPFLIYSYTQFLISVSFKFQPFSEQATQLQIENRSVVFLQNRFLITQCGFKLCLQIRMTFNFCSHGSQPLSSAIVDMYHCSQLYVTQGSSLGLLHARGQAFRGATPEPENLSLPITFLQLMLTVGNNFLYKCSFAMS